jgi:hypothetical protein
MKNGRVQTMEAGGENMELPPSYVNAAGAEASEAASLAGLDIPIHPDCHEAGGDRTRAALHGTDDRRYTAGRRIGELLLLPGRDRASGVLHNPEASDLGKGQGFDIDTSCLSACAGMLELYPGCCATCG